MLLQQLETPALVLDLDLFDQNIAVMQNYAKKYGFAVRPHYKSHRCTTIAHLQLAAGAKGITCSKLGEAVDLVEAGVEDVLIANQIVSSVKLAGVAGLAKCCRLTVCVDNADNIHALETAAATIDACIYCLIEYEVGMNRCGVDTLEHFYMLVREIQTCPHLVFEGIQAYAGQLSHEEKFETPTIQQ